MGFLTISAAARQAGVHPDTIRSYCRLNLLHPQRDSAGRRLFSDQDVQRIREVFRDNLARRPLAVGGRR